MAYPINIRSIGNDICALEPMSCRIEADTAKVEMDAQTFSDYVTGLRSQMDVINDVAVIPVCGVLGERLDDYDVFFGMCDYGDVRAKIAAANDDPMVSGIVLDIDSPGGYVVGTEETAAAIMASEKPVIAFTNTLAASAAYWLAVSADALYATPSSRVGSVGVYTLFYDWSQAFERAGIKAEMFKSGALKGIGATGVELSDEQREHLQQGVDELAAEFKAFVRSRRGFVDDFNMQGQVIRGRRALQANMVDRLGDLTSAVEEASDAAAIR